MTNLGTEDERTEFKRSTSELKEGIASMAAILNKYGEGTLYFGVKNNGDVCGQDVSDSTLREISQAVGNHIEPPVYPAITHEMTPDGKSYVKVAFSGNAAPYSCAGKYRIRVADEDVVMKPDQLREEFREAENRINPWDRRVSGKTADDIDEEALRKFVERGREKERITFEYTNKQEVLERLGLVEDGKLLNAAVALFCPSPLIDLKMGILASHARTDILDLKQEQGLLFDLVRKAETFIATNTRQRVDTFTAGPSPVYPEIPKDAVHEALMNAYAHRDWEMECAVVVDIYSDAVEIVSPGWFIKGQDPEEHLSGESMLAKSRNGLIANMLFRSGDIESYGTGIKRIKDLCDEANIEVEYVKTPDGTKLVFHRNEPFGRSFVVGESTDKVPNVVPRDTLFDTLSDTLKLSERDLAVLKAIIGNPEMTTQAISDETGLSLSTVKRAISNLQGLKVIARHGSKKTGKWIVIANNEEE